MEMRKKLKQFLSDESGFVSRDSLIKAGVRGIAIASLLMEGSQLLSEACSHSSHLSAVVPKHLEKTSGGTYYSVSPVNSKSVSISAPSHTIHVNSVSNTATGSKVFHTNMTSTCSSTCSY